MKHFLTRANAVLFGFAVFFFSVIAFAQDTPPIQPTDPNAFIQLLLASIGGIKGASTLAVAGIVIKLLVNALNLPFVDSFLGSKFKDWSGGIKLTIVLGLSYAGGILALMLPPTSLSLGAAFVHSSTLAAFMVLSNQIYKHYIEKSDAPKA